MAALLLRRYRVPALSDSRIAALVAEANARAAGGAPIVSVASENGYYIEGEPGLDAASPALSWLLSETFEPQLYGDATFLGEVRLDWDALFERVVRAFVCARAHPPCWPRQFGLPCLHQPFSPPPAGRR